MRTVTEAMRWRRSWKSPDLPCTPVDTAGLHGGVGRSATLLEPLQADGVGTAVLQRAEDLLEDPLVPLLAYRHRIPVVILEEHRADDALCAQRIPDRHLRRLQ